MLIEGKFTLEAPIQETWDFLLMPATLAACIPGCEKWETIDEKTFDGTIVAKVGAISVRFKFVTVLTELDPPKHLKAVGRGEDINKYGTFSQETTMDLRKVSETEVEVSYKSNVSVVGKLATFGDRIMKAKAKEVERELTRALKEKLLGRDITVPELKVSTTEISAGLATHFKEKAVSFFRRRSK